MAKSNYKSHFASPQITEQVIQKLADARLIVTQEEFVDVAHEALIRHWLLLRKWLDENRDRLREKRKIEAAAEEWNKQDKKKDYLFKGGQLKKAKAWQKGEGGKLGLSPLAGEFIKASEKHRQRALLLTAGWVTIPIFVAFLAVAPPLRQQGYDAALEKIKTPKQAGIKEALELLSEGCWIPEWMLGNFVTTALFGKCHVLSGANLSNANLIGANLSNASLSKANLSNASLSSANLSRANLIYAKNLSSASLSFANLSRANLIYAKNLSSASLSFANLSSANLSSADLRSANLSSANLSSAELSWTYFGFAEFQGINLTNANLEYSGLNNVKNLTPEQVKAGKNWEKAIYDDEFKKKLGLK
ncbi:MAG: pentapeptide repeat-containing protein [Rivularia sp. (in: cyanobacteria)]